MTDSPSAYPYQAAVVRPGHWLAYADSSQTPSAAAVGSPARRIPSSATLRTSLNTGPSFGGHGIHPFPARAAESLNDLSSLGDLIDGRSGMYEDRRVSDEDIEAQAQRLPRGKRADLREYYENMHAILDGWKEADEILDSQFPGEVLKRFGTIEQIERLRSRQQRRGSTSSLDSSYSRSSSSSLEDDEFGDGGHRRGSLAGRAASALSGFWFKAERSGMGKRPSSPRSHSANAVVDEESGLLGPSTPQGGRKRHHSAVSGYGALGGLSALTSIDDGDESAHAQEASEQQAEQPDDTDADDDEDDQLQMGVRGRKGAGQVRATSPNGHDATAVEHVPAPSETSGSLDRRLAEEREMVKKTSRGPAVYIAGEGSRRLSPSKAKNGGAAAESRPKASRSASSQRSAEPDPAPGGRSERERRKLLEYVPNLAQKAEAEEREAQFAINVNLVVNVLLLAGKGFAVLSSNSVSLLASLVDSALDLLSLVIIFLASQAIAFRSTATYHKYPVGKARLEPLSVVIFAVIMIASFIQVLIESVTRLFEVIRAGHGEGSAAIPPIGILFMVITIVIKTYVWLHYRRSKSSGVRAVAQDAENDVVFNAASLVFPVVGSFLSAPVLDPIGGVVLSIYIIYEWVETLFDLVRKLSGVAAGPQDMACALYLVTRFRSVNSVSAFELYHTGDPLVCEVDIVLPHTANLKSAHDLGEVAVYCLESLGSIERAFVHLDYDTRGQLGHIASRG